jgi:hypothetical protein
MAYVSRASPERPLGVAILAVLIGLFGALLLVSSLLLFVFGSALAGTGGFGFSGSVFVDALVLLILAIVLFVVATGLWDLRLWALVLSILVVGFLWLSDVFTGRLLSLTSLVEVVLLVYLVLVRHHFR